MGSPVYVFPEPGVNWCFECDGPPEWENAEDNECFICGADHSPLNAESNFYCRVHLDRDALIVPLFDKPASNKRCLVYCGDRCDCDARQQETP